MSDKMQHIILENLRYASEVLRGIKYHESEVLNQKNLTMAEHLINVQPIYKTQPVWSQSDFRNNVMHTHAVNLVSYLTYVLYTCASQFAHV